MVIQEIYTGKNLNNLLKKYDQKINIVLNLSVTLETIKKNFRKKILEKRADDKEAIVTKDLNYETNIKPVIDFYKQSNLLKVVNGEAGISEISDEISRLIEGIKGWLWLIRQYKYARFK